MKRVVERMAKAAVPFHERAFLRGFGVALADIWKLYHDDQMIRHLLVHNGLTLADLRDVDLVDADYAAICQALKKRDS